MTRTGHDPSVSRQVADVVEVDLSIIRIGPTTGLFIIAMLLLMPKGAQADSLTGAQRDAASQYFAALGSGDAQALAFAVHPDEIIKLRTRLITLLREETKHGDSTLRGRLFGSGNQLADLERLTAPSFFVALLRRIALHGREFQDVRWIGAIAENASLVWVVGRLKPLKDRGKEEVVQTVGLMPYGKDWKAIIPTEMQAQIEDLLEARGPANAVGRSSAKDLTAEPQAAVIAAGTSAPAPHELLTLLDSAEQALIAGKCDVYYHDYLSPNFRRLTPAKSLDTLVASCNNSLGMRETLITTLRIVRGLTPRLELEGSRATYDVSNQGLPYERFVLEKLKDRWYIAE